MDIQQIRSDFDHGNMISRPTWGELLVYAEQADAVLNGRQQAIGSLNMRIAELEARTVNVPRVASNPAAHDWAAPASSLPDLIARLRASIAGKESCEEATVFVANISAAIQWLEQASLVAPVVQAVPDGFVLAPIEPTDAMLKAGVHAMQHSYNEADSLADWREAYKANIAAAPSAPQAAPLAERDFEYAKNTVPGIKAVLYTDDINGKQVMRDDLWLTTTEQLNLLAKIGEDAQQAMAAPDRAVAYAIYGIGGGLIYLKEVKEIPKSDTTCEWRGDDGGLGDYWAGNEGLALMGKQAPQPIAAPAKHCGYTSAIQCNAVGCGHLEGQDEPIAAPADYDHNEGDGLAGRSQQPVPAPSASIDTPEFWTMLAALHPSGIFYSGESKKQICSHIDACAAQLVQQRATLSDEQIMQQWYNSHAECGKINHPVAPCVHFARAIIAAAEAK